MFLDTTTRSLQIFLGSAKATNDCPVLVDYVDFTTTTTTPGNQLSKTNGTGTVTILSSPSASTQRKVNLITICNTDTDFIKVTLQLNDNSTVYNYVNGLFLPPNSTLQFTDTKGWIVIDSAGNSVIATESVADIQVFLTNGIWTRPNNVTYSLVDVSGGGGSGGGGQGAAAGSIRAGGGAGGGGKRIQYQFLTSELIEQVSVVVASQVPGGNGGISAAGISGIQGNISYFGNYLIAYGGGAGAAGGATASTGGGGGGGAGGTANGSSAFSSSGQSGGAAFNSQGGASPTDAGGGGGGGSTTPANGYPSFLGGGAGGGGSTSTNPGANGASSFFSAGGGGGGGGINATSPGTAQNGGAGGTAGGSGLITNIGGGGTAGVANTSAGGNGADGQVPGYCGQGGGGGGGNNNGTGFNGGNGGIPGGGGGGGGGGTTTGGIGGVGAQGKVVVISW